MMVVGVCSSSGGGDGDGALLWCGGHAPVL
jgi:hypothetical protein